MAKKKEKNASKSLSTFPGQSATKSPSKDGSGFCSTEVVEALELRMKRSAGKGSTSATTLSSDTLPTIFLNEHDGKRLGVRRNDDTILLLLRAEDKASNLLGGALICKADVSSPSLHSPKSHNTPQNSVSPGTCHLHPFEIVDGMLESEKYRNKKNGPPSSTKTPDTLKTPMMQQIAMKSPPKSGFSFASGGGGDIYITPPPSTPSAAFSTPKLSKGGTHPINSVWIIPLSSPLGQDTASIICQNAKRVHLKVLGEAVAGQLSGFKRILSRLFLAQCTGRHLHESEIFSISFQGKPLMVQIDSIEGSVEENERNQLLLELEMENLNIDSQFSDEELPDIESQLWKTIRASLDKSNISKWVLLYKISHDTHVTFSSDDNAGPDMSSLSRGGSTAISTPKTFVVGLSPILERMRNLLLTPLLKPELFSSGSLKAPRGVLMYGNSGVGKSSLAKQLASELEQELSANIRVDFVNCASLHSYSAQAGEAERRLTLVFEKASLSMSTSDKDKKCGTLLIFDDIHLICPKRSGYNPGADRLAATLLGLLDGIGTASQKGQPVIGAVSSSVVVLAITQNPSLLDPALRRPGRLDYELEVPSPDEALARAEILKFQLKNLGEDFNVSEITDEQMLDLSNLAKGFNGADCMLSVKEALRLAMLRSHNLKKQFTFGADSANNSYHYEVTLDDLKAAIRATKPSAIKSITVEIPKVFWSSIGGMESVKQELREAIELPLTHAHLFEQLKIPPPRGILLYGPPGSSSDRLILSGDRRPRDTQSIVSVFIRMFQNAYGACTGNRRPNELFGRERT
jgi:ATP-dependent 26S proteasome regulatory subunit